MEFDDLIAEMIQTDNTPEVSTEDTPIKPATEVEATSLEDDPPKDTEPSSEVTTTSTDEEDSDTQYLAETSFNLLKEYGVVDLPEDFEFDGTPEAFEKALEITKENIKEQTARSL